MPDAAHLSLAEILSASAGYAGFVAILFVGSLLLPGPVREGALRPDGTRQRKRRRHHFCLSGGAPGIEKYRGRARSESAENAMGRGRARLVALPNGSGTRRRRQADRRTPQTPPLAASIELWIEGVTRPNRMFSHFKIIVGIPVSLCYNAL